MGTRCWAQVRSNRKPLASLDHWAEAFERRSWRAHPLKGARRAEHAIDLGQRWRLIVSIQGDAAVTIEEVSDHYDD
jgi:hypothetical protein